MKKTWGRKSRDTLPLSKSYQPFYRQTKKWSECKNNYLYFLNKVGAKIVVGPGTELFWKVVFVKKVTESTCCCCRITWRTWTWTRCTSCWSLSPSPARWRPRLHWLTSRKRKPSRLGLDLIFQSHPGWVWFRFFSPDLYGSALWETSWIRIRMEDADPDSGG